MPKRPLDTPTLTKSPSPVKLTDLTLPQLSQLKKQLDTELETLTTSFAQLRAAQGKFRDCLSSLAKGLADKNADRTILVPLTSSLYVPGTLADTDSVIVDVGTGFYVEKSKDDARRFYDGKVKDIQGNLTTLEGVVNAKTDNLRVLEEVLRQKILQANSPGAASAGGAGAVAASSAAEA